MSETRASFFNISNQIYLLSQYIPHNQLHTQTGDKWKETIVLKSALLTWNEITRMT